MVASAAAAGLMIAAGEPAVVVVFGERWHDAGVALVAMSGLNYRVRNQCRCAGCDQGSREDPPDQLVHPG